MNHTKTIAITNSFIVTTGLFLGGCGNAKQETSREKPNVILIMADDMGYSDLSCYGSEIQTPNIDQLAKNGKMFRQFYNEARCCPTRASLLTGLYQHQVGIGGMTEGQKYPDGTIIPSYIGYLNRNCVTLAEALKENGYQTFLSGKWHVGDSATQWPSDRGFDKTYSLIWGASNFFNTRPFLNQNQEIVLSYNGKQIEPEPGFYFTEEFTKYALKFINEKDDSKPYFLYLSYTAPHWPIHALEEDIALYQGKYMKGWDSTREERFNRMIEMGIVPPGTKLSPKHKSVPDWETLNQEEKKTWDRRMAVYAAMIHRMDVGIGQVVDLLKEKNELDNTVIMFLSDNGATKAEIYNITSWCAERGEPIGSEKSFQSYGKWANTSNTPYRQFKSQTYEGGIITPFIFHWPKKIAPGFIPDYPGHIIDVMPTLLDISKGEYPETYHGGKEIIPLEGQSLMPVLNDSAYTKERTLYFEHFGSRAVRDGDWKLVYFNKDRDWYLYNLKDDPTELVDLKDTYPGKTNELKEKYFQWAERVGALPDTVYEDLVLMRNADWFE